MKQILGLIIIMVIFANNCCKSKETGSIKGSLTFINGTVEIVKKEGSVPAKKDDVVGEGDTIKTGPKSVAILQFENDTASIEIQEDAEFNISKFNSKQQELISIKGNFWIKAKKLNKDSSFNVIMPTSVAGIRGTSFYSFELKEEGIHGICHCQGAVDFQDKTSSYKGSHDSDYAVLTKNGKTVTITPEDLKAAGMVRKDSDHYHSSIDNSPLGKKAEHTDEAPRFRALAMKKFAEK
jgi:hypothetical protein